MHLTILTLEIHKTFHIEVPSFRFLIFCIYVHDELFYAYSTLVMKLYINATAKGGTLQSKVFAKFIRTNGAGVLTQEKGKIFHN